MTSSRRQHGTGLEINEEACVGRLGQPVWTAEAQSFPTLLSSQIFRGWKESVNMRKSSCSAAQLCPAMSSGDVRVGCLENVIRGASSPVLAGAIATGAIREPMLSRGEDVLVHLYDLNNDWAQMNDVLVDWFGIGALHVSVEVFGWELTFGTTGVGRSFARSHQAHLHRQTLYMDRTLCSRAEVDQKVAAIAMEWRGSDYNLFTRNCASFCDEFCQRLGAGRLPPWVMRLAEAASRVPAPIIRALLGPVDLGRGGQETPREGGSQHDAKSASERSAKPPATPEGACLDRSTSTARSARTRSPGHSVRTITRTLHVEIPRENTEMRAADVQVTEESITVWV